MIQDRNVHRDAQLLRKVISVPLVVPAAGVDQDEPIYATVPRYNWRITDMYSFVANNITAPITLKLQAARVGHAVGSPQFGQNSAPTFTVEEFWFPNSDGGGFGNQAAQAAETFSDPFTILDGFWGVVLLLIDQTAEAAFPTIAGGPVMAFGTEEIALANCPKVPPGAFGRAGILTIQAVGGDFIAQTTNTDAALVAAFNTAPQVGHSIVLPVGLRTTRSAVLGQKLKDASGSPLLQGIADLDNIVLSVRSAGAPVLTDPAVVTIEYRPWPVGGEGLGDTSVSQTPSQFVP